MRFIELTFIILGSAEAWNNLGQSRLLKGLLRKLDSNGKSVKNYSPTQKLFNLKRGT